MLTRTLLRRSPLRLCATAALLTAAATATSPVAAAAASSASAAASCLPSASFSSSSSVGTACPPLQPVRLMSTDAKPAPRLLKRAVVLPAQSEHKFTVIFMHGLGDAGESFVDVFDMLKLPKSVKVILPNAPQQPVTVNGGMVMPSWYDIKTLGSNRGFEDKQDDESILASAELVQELIDAEASALGSYKRVLLGGFSQGGAMTLHMGLRSAEQLGGLGVMSGYALIPYREEFVVQKQTPLFIYHGAADQVVPLKYARATKEWLDKKGVTVAHFTEEPRLAHSLSMASINQLGAFFKDCMNQV